MAKIILNKAQVSQLVWDNRYPVKEEEKFLSRCIDGRYEKNSKLKSQMSKLENNNFLPALSIPGADLGELALILATANDFGLAVDYEKVFQSLIKVVGGLKNFSYHTDSHHGGLALGCGHFGQILKDFVAYNLQKKDIEFLEEKLKFLEKKDVLPVILEGEHLEGAVLLIKGDWAVYPRYYLATDEGKKLVEVFAYHQSLADERRKILAKRLIDDGAVVLYPGCDEDYLYQVMSDEAENHLFETLNRLGKDLPIYSVVFDAQGGFDIEKR